MTGRASILARLALAVCVAVLASACSLLGESPEPKDVELRFEGLGPIGREDAVRRIAYAFEDFAQAAEPEPALDDAAFELELLLHENGFRTARVEARLVRRESGKPVARFDVERGPRTRLADVDVPGVAKNDRDDVDGILRAAELSEWYSERAVEVGASALREWYSDRGYVDAVVHEPTVVFGEDGEDARVTIRVEPGARYVLGRVDVEVADGGAWPAEVPRSAVDEALRDLSKAAYSERVMRAARGRIASVFGDHGHPDAVVALARRDLDPRGVVLAFEVRPGPRVRVGEVRFEGHEATRESFLRRRVELEPGEWYSRSAQRKSLANLSRAGLFDRVAIDLEPTRAVDDGVETRDVVVELEEAAAREFHVEPGYGSYERLRLGIGARQRNLFGTGRILDFTGSVAELAQRADLSLIDPWILGPEATAIATVFWNRRQEPSFLRLEQGVELGASWRLTEHWGVRGSWEYRISDVSDVEVDAPELIEDVDVSELSFEPTWDTRDAYDDPHEGQLTKGAVDLSVDALGSQVEYVRLRLEHAHFVPLGSKLTLALSGRVGWISPLGSTEDIPIQERFFNGGENSVRSFRESRLGPVDADGTPLGGEATTTATVELRQALGRRFQAAAFLDAGTVELRNEDVFAFNDPGFAVGLGLRYLLPIGPIRLDGALNPDPEENESDGAIHLSVGFSF